MNFIHSDLFLKEHTLKTFHTETINEQRDAIISVSFRDAYWVAHRVCFSNVYLYSTLTRNSVFQIIITMQIYFYSWLIGSHLSFQAPLFLKIASWYLMMLVHPPICAPNSTEGREVGPQKSCKTQHTKKEALPDLLHLDTEHLNHPNRDLTDGQDYDHQRLI